MRYPTIWGAGLTLAIAGGCQTPVPPPPTPHAPRAAEYRSTSVTEALDGAKRVVETRGFAADAPEWRGFLVEHGTAVSDAPLRSGSCYVIVAAASPAMNELDLAVYDSDGGEVARDSDTGRRAALRYCPSQTGMYYVIARAPAGSGVFAARRFKGPTGLPVRVDDVFRGLAEARETQRNTP